MVGTAETRFQVVVAGDLCVGKPADLRLDYTAGERGFRSGGNLWIFYDIRQFTSTRQQCLLPPDGSIVTGPPGTSWSSAMLAEGCVVRTLDLYPQVPEFLYALRVICTGGKLSPGERVTIRLHTDPDGFRLPENAIDEFHFWLVEDPDGKLTFVHAPGDKYHYFYPRQAALSLLQSNPLSVVADAAAAIRVVCPSISTGRADARVRIEDGYGNPIEDTALPIELASSVATTTVPTSHGPGGRVAIAVGGEFDTVVATCGALTGRSNPVRVDSTPSAPRLFWGELHGMAFNQRPYWEYFAWAKDVACLDFAAGQLFSYNACVQEVWETLKEAWRDYDLPGTFVSLPAVEFGTPPDLSHRIAYFPHVEALPPIFCEERQAAHDPKLQAKFSPETVYCEDYRAFYEVVRHYGGLLHGHYHTRFYAGEDLAEIYQKQPSDVAAEEAKINRAIQGGLKLGIVAGSDTHDSRPTNPFPEPGPVRPAGITGVWADRLDRAALFAALRQRRCFATTGARMVVDFRVNGHLMGATVHANHYQLSVEVLGTAEISRIELVENGQVRRTFTPRQQHVTVADEWPARHGKRNGVRYCYARVYQADGERAWSSPIWLAQ